jgi:hypothetical protein
MSGAAVRAAQRAFPFLRRVAPRAASAESDMADTIMAGLRELSTQQTHGISPWLRLIEGLPPGSTTVGPEGGSRLTPSLAAWRRPTGGLRFRSRQPGAEDYYTADLSRGGEPTSASLDVLESSHPSRIGLVSSIAERWPTGSGRRPPTHASLKDRQEAVDEILRRLRAAGIKTLEFTATPGSRVQLYEKLTGFPATRKVDPLQSVRLPTWLMDIMSPAQRELPFRGKRLPGASEPRRHMTTDFPEDL